MFYRYVKENGDYEKKITRYFWDFQSGALDIKLTNSDIAYLEEIYVPHPIVGAINHNPEQGVILLDEKK